MTAEERPCSRCGLKEGSHLYERDCIEAMRKAMLKQRQLAESFSFDISMRYLGALEELAADPEIGVGFSVRRQIWDKDGKEDFEVYQLPPRQVAGVFQAILRKYREAGDWTPLADAKKEVASLRMELDQLKAEVLVGRDPPHS